MRFTYLRPMEMSKLFPRGPRRSILPTRYIRKSGTGVWAQGSTGNWCPSGMTSRTAIPLKCSPRPTIGPVRTGLNRSSPAKAISRIKHWFKTEERERSISQGREICEREFRKKGLNFNNYLNSPQLAEAAKAFSLKSVDDLLAGIRLSQDYAPTR